MKIDIMKMIEKSQELVTIFQTISFKTIAEVLKYWLLDNGYVLTSGKEEVEKLNFDPSAILTFEKYGDKVTYQIDQRLNIVLKYYNNDESFSHMVTFSTKESMLMVLRQKEEVIEEHILKAKDSLIKCTHTYYDIASTGSAKLMKAVEEIGTGANCYAETSSSDGVYPDIITEREHVFNPTDSFVKKSLAMMSTLPHENHNIPKGLSLVIPESYLK